MDINQPPLIRIYQSCQLLITIKRKLFETLKIDLLPHSPQNQQHRNISSKIYLYINKISKQMKNQLCQLSLDQLGQKHLSIVNQVVGTLKNENQFLSQEEKLIFEAHQIIEKWNKIDDPLVYYCQGQRIELKKKLKSKLQEIHTCSVACKQTKKPLYVRKLQRQLRQNLSNIAQNERRYNYSKFNIALNVRNKIIKLISKLLQSLGRRQNNGFVECQKNKLLTQYIDVFHGSEAKILEKQIKNYRKDLLKTVKSITTYFQEEKQCFDCLLAFLRSLQKTIKAFQSQLLSEEDHIIEQISEVSADINHIVDFQESLQIINSAKYCFISSSELGQIKSKIPQMKRMLESAIIETGQFAKTILKRQNKSKNGQITQFIEDKKFIEQLIKKQQTFETTLFNVLTSFFEKLYKNRKISAYKNIERQDIKKLKYEKAVQNIFQNYFKEIENKERVPESSSTIHQSYKLSQNQQKEIKDIEQFIDKLVVFEDTDWNESFQCSLGPRLLIHGSLKILPEGIFYFSHFNKKNYFFGKTKIFIPKQDILEINKDTALVVFDDVIDIVTKKRNVYFHALGKRKKMLELLNQSYFPEAVLAQQFIQQLQFNEFKGDITAVEQRIKPYLNNLEYFFEEGQIPNLNLRTYFHKYESEEQFHYQGKVYDNFKTFSVEVAKGTHIQGTKFTPGIPSYMQLQTSASSQEDILVSQKFFTYKKEIPMIPFVSKGGHGICQEKLVYTWAGPNNLVCQSFTTVSGFSLTQGMLFKARYIFEEKKNSVHYKVSGQVVFETSSAMNNMIRAPALGTYKSHTNTMFEIIKKLSKVKKSGRISKGLPDDDNQSHFEEKIQKLEQQNIKLKKLLFRTIVGAIIVYLITIVIMIY